ncbi:MAG: hypothetical protein P8L44_10300 [Opitutales bacterium]|jgi:hypothetical protein|nr:hypothetical protein [Opitutales bacterium]MDG2168298.1 hypothetical protein [Opitutales bacterium]|tara:strand:+ start:770 stop:1096 length:327 start_codon:yes stop_codon:yes gene_type:complete
MKHRSLFVLTLLTLCITGSTLTAGVVYTLNTKEFQDMNAGGKMTVAIEGKDLHMEMQGQGSKDGSVIFKSADNSMIMVDHQRKQYTVMDAAMIEKIAGQMNKAMAQYQ